MRADGRVEKVNEQKGNWNVARLLVRAARLAPPNLCGQDFTQRISNLAKRYTNYKKKMSRRTRRTRSRLNKKHRTAPLHSLKFDIRISAIRKTANVVSCSYVLDHTSLTAQLSSVSTMVTTELCEAYASDDSAATLVGR